MILPCGHEYENGSGRRKKCPDCARAHHLTQMNDYSKRKHANTYEHKRGPHKCKQ
jgi:hypothetical protein